MTPTSKTSRKIYVKKSLAPSPEETNDANWIKEILAESMAARYSLRTFKESSDIHVFYRQSYNDSTY